jgi:hypothetical protein
VTWSPSLVDEIAGMFARYSTHADEIEDVLEERRARYFAYHAEYRRQPGYRAKASKYMTTWRKRHPEKARAHSRKWAKRERERAKVDPVFGAKYRAMRTAANKRWRAKKREQASA